MSTSYGGTPPGITGTHYGGASIGTLGADVPSDGESGAGYLYAGLTLPADAAKEVRGPITRWPGGTLTVYEDSSFSYAGSTDYALYQLYVDGAASAEDIGYGPGIGRVSFNIGPPADSALSGALQLDASDAGGALASHPSAVSGAVQLAALIAGGLISSYPDGWVPDVVRGFELFPGARRRLEVTGRQNMIERFDDKDPAERIPLSFNFGRDFDGVAASPAPVVSVVRLAGAEDEDPSAMIDGAPIVSGARVFQWCQGGVSRTRYYWRCEAYSTDGAKMVIAGEMTVRNA